MRRFHFDDDEENEDELPDEKFIGPEFFSMAQFPMDTSNSLLDLSVKVCEKLFFWKIYSLQTKLKKIKDTYIYLRDLENLEDKDNDAPL